MAEGLYFCNPLYLQLFFCCISHFFHLSKQSAGACSAPDISLQFASIPKKFQDSYKNGSTVMHICKGPATFPDLHGGVLKGYVCVNGKWIGLGAPCVKNYCTYISEISYAYVGFSGMTDPCPSRKCSDGCICQIPVNSSADMSPSSCDYNLVFFDHADTCHFKKGSDNVKLSCASDGQLTASDFDDGIPVKNVKSVSCATFDRGVSGYFRCP